METILALDPSLSSTGYAILCKDTKICCLRFGTIRRNSVLCLSRCLLAIHQHIKQLITEYSPVSVAVEAIIYVQNHRTAISMGKVHGIILLSAAEQGLPIYEYAPKKVKRAVVGCGTAEKHQTAFMVRALLGLTETPSADAADAIAVGLCHFQSSAVARRGIRKAVAI